LSSEFCLLLGFGVRPQPRRPTFGTDGYELLTNTKSMSHANKSMGRPAKAPGQKYETHSLKFPPTLWRLLEELVPRGERSAVIHQALERELKRRRRQAAKRASLPAQMATEADPWRLAAEAARDYYETDPEAVEWAMFAGDTRDELR